MCDTRLVTMRDLGREVRRCRRLRGLTRANLSELSGVSAQTIAHWEGPHPPKQPQMPKVVAVARACGIDVNEALTMVGYAPQSEPKPVLVADDSSREQLKAELLEMWDSPEMPDHLRRILVAMAAMAMGRGAPLQAVQSLPGFGASPDGDGAVPHGSAPQYHDGDRVGVRVAWGFRCLIIPKDVAARIASEADQQHDHNGSSC